MTRYFDQVTGQVQARVRPALNRGVSALMLIASVAGLVLLLGGMKVIPANQAIGLGLFAGKAASQADKTIIGQVVTCGRETGTILAVSADGPPLRINSITRGPNPSLLASYGPKGESEVSCLARKLLNAGATAQGVPADAVSHSGPQTANAKAFVEQMVSDLTTIGAV